VEELKLAFDLFDEASNGFLTKSDLKGVLEKYGKLRAFFVE
jgi:Ca2+-binding EF-hand superfamily protein